MRRACSLTPADLTRQDRGHTSRDVPLPLRELLGTLDGERCRYLGCAPPPARPSRTSTPNPVWADADADADADPTHLDPTGTVNAHTLTPDRIEARMDLGYVVSVLLQHAA